MICPVRYVSGFLIEKTCSFSYDDDMVVKSSTNGKSSFIQGLLKFLKQYSVIGLAIGVITAEASKDVVDSLVQGVFNPAIRLVVPADFSHLSFNIHGVSFDIGAILNSVLTFIIIMTFLYFIIKTILKNDELLQKK